MSLKVLQREKYKKLRKDFDKVGKESKDKSIFEKIVNSKVYLECEDLLTYVSMGFEVDTLRLIKYSLDIGKNVYAPLVTKEKHVMKFYRVNSVEELCLNKMGILEPKAFDEWSGGKTLCIVPAIVYDLKGFRIGYGGGYYDYFLSRYKVETIGIIYDEFILDKVDVDVYDHCVSKIVTESRVISFT